MSSNSTSAAADLYLDLLKGCLTRSKFLDEQVRDVQLPGWFAPAWNAYIRAAKHADCRIVKPVEQDVKFHAEGRARLGETMIGHARLDNIQHCVMSVLEDDVPGDLIETGVWRGGAALLM